MSSFEPDRLRQIREARGLTKTRVAELAEVSPSAISQYESGTITPSTETLDALTGALEVPESFLRTPSPVRLDLTACHFRRKSGVPKWERRKALAWGELALDFVQNLERHVEFPEVNLPRVEKRPTSRKQIEKIAEDVRTEWGLGFGPLGNLVWLAEHRGVVAVELRGHSEKFDAFSTWSADRPLMFLMTNKSSASRRRFDVAHELGHLILHRHLSPETDGLEDEAHAFASSFLLPREPFLAECPQQLSWPHLIEFKKRWKTSLQAVVVRGHHLGVYSKATYRRAFYQLNQRGWRTNEPYEPELEKPSLFWMAVDALQSQGFGSPLRIGEKLVNLYPEDIRQILQGPSIQAA